MCGQKFLRGQVWWIGTSKDVNYVGTVQSPNRPYVIVSNNVGNRNAGYVMAVPCTTEIKRLDMPTHLECDINGKKNMIMCEQIKTVDTDDLLNYIFTLDDSIMNKIDIALKMALGIVDKHIEPIEENENVCELSATEDTKRSWDENTKKEYINYYEKYGKKACAEKYGTKSNTKAYYLRFCKALNITPIGEESETI